ncbi:hypothetical protein PHLCEN_2v8992 [Hermanssonia centrifuga]|uniref:Secreted protein n=1 Tax=Hermanssonia centrifuga TaxID=98765 RepID=A0A2R6NS88_9APHY|nr:hypothetical protein PHLCEN_2v8992 [Hermanssonia centrifuga]
MATKVRYCLMRAIRVLMLIDDVADSANCCSGSHDTAATCPSSNVAYYSYFSTFRFPDHLNLLQVSHLTSQRAIAPIPMHTLTTKAAEQLSGPATPVSRLITPSRSALLIKTNMPSLSNLFYDGP